MRNLSFKGWQISSRNLNPSICKRARLPPLHWRACAGTEWDVLDGGGLGFSEEEFSSRGGSQRQRPHPHPPPGATLSSSCSPCRQAETWVGCWVTRGAGVAWRRFGNQPARRWAGAWKQREGEGGQSPAGKAPEAATHPTSSSGPRARPRHPGRPAGHSQLGASPGSS